MKNKRKILISGVASFAFLIVAEITLRLVWGFGKMPLFISNDIIRIHGFTKSKWCSIR